MAELLLESFVDIQERKRTELERIRKEKPHRFVLLPLAPAFFASRKT